MGDGGFGMNMAEITTAVKHGINSIAVIMDNGCWGSEIAYQKEFYNDRFIGADVLSPRYDEVARLCGANGYYASQPGETADALRDALAADKPAIIHVKVDPQAVMSFRKDGFSKSN
jgi:thiamine pyrophosphate-dependent acetolactate synthase large subunit-like protein